jgi:replicative DNA helicase
VKANGTTRSADQFDRQPPNDQRAEIGVLGSLFLLPSAFAEVSLLVRADDFYDPAHARLFRRMAEINEAGKPLDATIVVAELRSAGELDAIGGMPYLSKIVNAVPNAAHVAYYAGIVADTAAKRRVIIECTNLLKDAYDDQGTADELLTSFASASGRLSQGVAQQRDLVTLGQAAAEVIDALSQPAQVSTVHRAAWGIPSVDEDLGPIMPGEVCVIAARPGNGKTSFAQQCLRHSAMRDRPAMIVSLEMTRGELAGRELARLTGVDSRTIRSGEVNPDEIQRLRAASADVADLPLYVWSPAKATLEQIRGMVAHAVSRHGVRLVAVDYLQLIETERTKFSDSRRDELAQVSRGLKRMAKEFAVPFIVLSQINREGERDNKEPTLGQLRECGAIEEDADFVVFLHCADPKADNTREFIARKVRGAPKGRKTLKWIGSRTEFTDLDARDHKNFDPALDAWNHS